MDDLIRRSDAIKAMADYLDLLGVARQYAKSVISKVPAVEPKQGEWIDIGGYEVCKNCHEVKRFPHWSYCPNCGADMRKGADDEHDK